MAKTPIRPERFPSRNSGYRDTPTPQCKLPHLKHGRYKQQQQAFGHVLATLDSQQALGRRLGVCESVLRRYATGAYRLPESRRATFLEVVESRIFMLQKAAEILKALESKSDNPTGETNAAHFVKYNAESATRAGVKDVPL